jgi:hypothetical protein
LEKASSTVRVAPSTKRAPANQPATPPAPRLLGERAARNKKLNEWLREVLGEEGIKDEPPETPANRVDRNTAPPEPVAK